MSDEHEAFMRAAIEEARKSLLTGDVPVGCIIVREGHIIGRGHNRREFTGDASAHAELEAIRAACRHCGSWRLHGTRMYVTLEPCPMCAGGLINARIDTLFYGAKEPEMGCCGSVLNLFEERFHHHPRIYGGLLETECSGLLQDFFRSRRSIGS